MNSQTNSGIKVGDFEMLSYNEKVLETLSKRIPKNDLNRQQMFPDAAMSFLLPPWRQGGKMVPRGFKMEASGLPNDSFKHQK